MELKVWVEGIQRIVCGVTVNTTCQDVVFALAHATGKVGRFTLIERWRNNERLLAPNENPLKLLLKWGEYANDVQFILQRSETKYQLSKQQQTLQQYHQTEQSSNSNIHSKSNNIIINKINNNNNNVQNQLQQQLQTTELNLSVAHERAKEFKKSFGSTDNAAKQDNVGIVKGIPQQHISHNNNNDNNTSPTVHMNSPAVDVEAKHVISEAPLIPQHEKSHSNPTEMSTKQQIATSRVKVVEPQLNSFDKPQNKSNDIYQHLGADNSKSINEINLAEVRNALDRGTTTIKATAGCNFDGSSNDITFTGKPNITGSAENLMDIFMGNASSAHDNKMLNSPNDLYKQTPTISANGALVPPPYRNPPPPRHSPLQSNNNNNNNNQQSYSISTHILDGDLSTTSITTTNTTIPNSDLNSSQALKVYSSATTYSVDYQNSRTSSDYELGDYEHIEDLVTPSTMDDSESTFPAAQYNDLLQLIKYQREKINAQQKELTKYDAEIVYLEAKERDQAQELEAISREITLVDQMFRQGSEQLQTLQYVEEENELVKQQEKTLKSEIALLRSKLANCETELLQCKNKIRLLMDDIEVEQRTINSKQNKRQHIERDFLMEMERIQCEIDQAIHNTDTSNKSAENLKKEILLIENAISEKKRQVEQLVNEMKEANLQSLTSTTSEEIKHLLEGSNKPGSSRRIIGSPRQLENAVPTSKNPHGVWV